MTSKLIIAANRLPVSVAETSEGLRVVRNAGGVATAMSGMLNARPSMWIGYAGIGKRIGKEKMVALGMPKQLEPIFIEDDIYERYYNRVANGSLWPVLHGFMPEQMYTPADWSANLVANQAFADKIAAVARPGDLIWVHDFHLMMLPKLLRDAGLTNRIGYFLHIPFARLDLFRQLPNYRDMLASLQVADLCGFQTPADARRFRQILQQTSANGRVDTTTKAFPIGIDYDTYHTAVARPNIAARKQVLDKKLAGKTVILSVSRLDYTKGIVEQLRAVELLLEHHADLVGKLVYKVIVSPSREALHAYQTIKLAAEKCVGEINARFGTDTWEPIEYEYRNVDFEELVSWYVCADTMLVSPLIDGMNLVAKEYIAARQDDTGVLILSKTAGAAATMREALLVDATQPPAIARALEQAIAMPLAERQERFAALREHVRTVTVFTWAEQFCDALLAQPQSSSS